MSELIDKVMTDCLAMMEKNNQTLADCLAKYPDHEKELRELFLLASSLNELKKVVPSREFSQTAMTRLVAKLPDRNVSISDRIARIFLVNKLQPKYKFGFAALMIGIVVVLMVLSTGFFAVNAAAPGDLLYGLDRKLEQVHLSMAVSPEKYITLRLGHAAERLEEANRKLAVDDLDQALVAFEAYRNEIYQTAKMIAGLSSDQQDAVLAQFYEHIAVQRHGIAETEQNVPETARIAIQNALNPTSAAQDQDSPQGPADCAPQGPAEAAPQGSAGDPQQGIEESGPHGEGCNGEGSAEGAPQGPSEESPQSPSEEPPQGPTNQVPPRPGNNQLPNLDNGKYLKMRDG